MKDLRSLGIKPFGKQRPFPKVSEEAIREFEKAFNVVLPDSYLKLLRFANGGSLELCEYDDPVTSGIGGINDFYGVGDRKENEKAEAMGKWEYGNLWGETMAFKKYMLAQGGIPFARDGGDNQLFFDYRELSPPCISRFILSGRTAYRLAESFDAFVDMLHAKSSLPKNSARRIRPYIEKRP
jgi:hypothetical protein